MRLGLLLGAGVIVAGGSACDSTINLLPVRDLGPMGDGPPAIEGLVALAVIPASKTLGLTGGKKAKVQFKAEGTFEDASTKDVTSRVKWTVENNEPGSVAAAGLYSANGQQGGKVIIIASAIGDGGLTVTGRGTLVVSVRHTIITSGVSKDAPKLFAASKPRDATADKVPAAVYPSDGTLFPRNLRGVLFQWRRGKDNTLYHLGYKSTFGSIDVYTKGDGCPPEGDCLKPHKEARCWGPSVAQWGWIAGSNADGSASWVVEAVDEKSPAVVYRAKVGAALRFSSSEVRGTVYYWSTTAQGIRRALMKTGKSADFLTPKTPYPNKPLKKCVACHTVSRNGKRLAANIDKSVGVFDLAKPYPPVVDYKSSEKAPVSWKQKSWTTFSPDTRLVVSSHDGKLTLRDGDTGKPKTNLTIGGSQKHGTMPDWSPDGTLLAFARSADKSDRMIKGSSVAVAPYAKGTFGAAKTLVAGAAAAANYFPIFSPDSQWIAFVRSVESSENDPTSTLFLVDRAGAGAPVALTRANTVVSGQVVTGGLHNSMPTWAPSSSSSVEWIAFSSSREYGLVRGGKKLKQIWVAGIDLAQAQSGKDPSHPAFWLPIQGACENVHRPFWVQAASSSKAPDAGVGPADAGSCLAQGAACVGSPAPCCAGLCCLPGGDLELYSCETCVIE